MFVLGIFHNAKCLNATAITDLYIVITDSAAYTLGFCYREGLQGFKCDNKKATKWLQKVTKKPDDMVIWGYKYYEDHGCYTPTSTAQVKQYDDDKIDKSLHRESTGQNKLFNETKSLSATSISTNKNEHVQLLNKFYLNLTSISEKTSGKCEVCSGIFEHKDIMGTRCHYCAYKDFDRLLGLDTNQN